MFGGGPSQSHVSPCSLLQSCVTWRTMPRGSHAPSATSYTFGPEDLQTSDNEDVEDVMNCCIILGLGKDRGQICAIQLSRIETYSDIDGACLPPTPHFPFLLIVPLGNPSHPRAEKTKGEIYTILPIIPLGNPSFTSKGAERKMRHPAVTD